MARFSQERKEAVFAGLGSGARLHKACAETQIVPALMDQGVYVASESAFYRVLKEKGQLHHRGQAMG